MSPTKKKKSGVGQGTGKKGWNRWQAGAKKSKGVKPYKSKGTKNPIGEEEDFKEI